MNYIIREIKEEEYPILSDFLYEAFLFQRVWKSRQRLSLNSRSCKYILPILEKKMIGA